MRYAITVLIWLVAMVAPASAQWAFDPGDLWKVPPAPVSSGFYETWDPPQYRDDLLWLAVEGDHISRNHLIWLHLAPDWEAPWIEDAKREGDPILALMAVDHTIHEFNKGRATADDVRAALAACGPNDPDTEFHRAILDASGGTEASQGNDDRWLANHIAKGDAALDRIACRWALKPLWLAVRLVPACREQARRGDAEAAFKMGQLHHQRADDFHKNLLAAFRRTLHLKPDLKGAIGYYRQSANLGHGAALGRLALLTAIGRGVARDPADALRLAEASAAKSDPEGMAVLGLLLLQGRGIAADPARAVELIRQAAEHGNRMAQYSMAAISFRGKVVPYDIVGGLTWLHLAQLARTEAAAIEEYGDLTVEPWPRTLVIGNSYRNQPDRDFEALSRAAALRRALAADGRWPYWGGRL